MGLAAITPFMDGDLWENYRGPEAKGIDLQTDTDKLASALKLVEAGIRPAQVAKQLGLGRSTLYRELAAIRQQAPSTPALEVNRAEFPGGPNVLRGWSHDEANPTVFP